MLDLNGKVAIVTGAARGLGEATTRLLVEAGAKVVMCDLLEEQGQSVANELGDSAVFMRMDVTQQSDWDAAIALAEEKFGLVNVLVNNAGVLMPAAISDMTEEYYMKVIQINQLGTFLGIKAVIEPMKKAGVGSIINVSSMDGIQSKNGLMAYSASKWAVRGMTKTAAIELGPHNIRVNSVHPGGMFTDMVGANGRSEPSAQEQEAYKDIPIPRTGYADEVGRVIRFLASDEASYSTGAEFKADGGWTAGMRNDALPTS